MTILPSGEEIEVVDNSSKKRPARKGGWKKYYVFDFNLRYQPDNIRLVNEPPLDLRTPEGQHCGFRPLPEAPKIVIEHKGSRELLDISQRFSDEKHFISDRLQEVISSIDSKSCAFVRCEVEMTDGGLAPNYWICEVAQILYAFDDEFSNYKKSRRPGRDWVYSVGYPHPLCIKDDIVGGAHLFRLKLPDGRASLQAYCDDTFRAACLDASNVAL